MRLFLVLGEAHFYQPNFAAKFLRSTKDGIIGAILVTKAPVRADLTKYLIKNFYYLTLPEIFKLGFSMAKAIVLDKFGSKSKDSKFYSVESVFKTFNIKYFEVQTSINKKEILNKIRETNPDVIISSNPLIFKDEILNLPKICCLNRHSSLLPAYGGLWPVFHAVKNNEKKVGASIHLMVSGIDKGAVLAQKSVVIEEDDSVSSLYEKTFDISSVILLEALDKVRKRDFTPVINSQKESYFSNPTKEDWELFRKSGNQF